ncbi:hypothetical protein DIE15_21105 [Burkholderia sp. Bp9031]|nr:hypothetical protein DIE15_21105 [Burkholderia sp. Bp9031]
MTYAQFRESGPGSPLATALSSQNSYLVVFIYLSHWAGDLSNAPEGRPARLCGGFSQLFNKVIHMRCG